MKRGTTSLQLLEGETASHSGLHVVLLRGAVDNGAEQSASGARSDRGSLRLAEQSAASLLSGLIEPGLHALIPVLLEVGIRQNVVVLHLAKIYRAVRYQFTGKSTISKDLPRTVILEEKRCQKWGELWRFDLPFP